MFKFRYLLSALAALTAAPIMSTALPAGDAAASASCYNTVYQQGASGDCVTHIQNRLAIYGCFAGASNGSFGRSTHEAVMRFQTANWLASNGRVGIETLRALDAGNSRRCSAAQATAPAPTPSQTPSANPQPSGTCNSLAIGSSGDCVRRVQERLQVYGCGPGPIDGIYGNMTASAVMRFQAANGLNQTGSISSSTLSKLNAGNSRYCGTSTSSVNSGANSFGNAPANSGTGRRIVLDMSRNRFWLVDAGNTVTYTGRTVDNESVLQLGTYHIQGRRRTNYSTTGDWILPNFIRITGGMGFHEIPIRAETPFGRSTGVRMHSESELGLSGHVSGGCVRVSQEASAALWAFASYGTTVVVIP